MFDGNEASRLCDLLMDYDEGTPEYDSTIRKLLAARDSKQDFTKEDLLLILDVMKEYFDDTAESLTPSYYSRSFSSVGASDVLSEREFFYKIRKRIQDYLSLSQSES